MRLSRHFFTKWLIVSLCLLAPASCAISRQQKRQLKEKVKSMFLHGYQSYMTHAYPADELMPLSCKGRWRSHGSGRGDIDDAMGNFSLTLVDTLDTLVLLDETEEFERVVKLVIASVRFEQDIVVSVFETNIRMVGGLLAAHVLAKELQRRRGEMMWYRSELLDLAQDLGYVLLKAFDSATGMPYPRINLKYGLDGLDHQKHTCAACAGTMLLEFAALSRLTGDPIFEEKSRLAMDYLWHKRHSSSSLMGHIIDVDSGDWIRRESGIGAGLDSYYEYVLKTYILLGDETYLHRFHRHYQGLLKYVMVNSRMQDVHMHQPQSTSKPYLDALTAFFPGLQVLYGDVELAKDSFRTLHKVVQRYNFLPEAFTPEPELRMYWAESYLRPEFIESTYFLYSATKDPFYLEVGENLVESLEIYSRVKCGYAALKDTNAGTHDDRMDSFFLSETLKYLYLLFSEPEELLVDLHDYIFTTEAHLLPVQLARQNVTFFPRQHLEVHTHSEEPSLSCPSSHLVVNFSSIWDEFIDISPLDSRDASAVPQCRHRPEMSQTAQQQRLQQRSVLASEINWENPEHVILLAEMGITVVKRDGTILISQDAAKAKHMGLAAEGMLFLQEIAQTFRQPSARELFFPPAAVRITSEQTGLDRILKAAPAQFGKQLGKDLTTLKGKLAYADPPSACTADGLTNIRGNIAVVSRGSCMFVEKARNVEGAGAVAMIVVDNKEGTSFQADVSAFAMSGDPGSNNTAVTIPALFLYDVEGKVLLDAFNRCDDLVVTMGPGQ
ncbi:ER degradation-enhancing alpha-mannosidase-like protein 3 [Hypsibius exemplaris]|uniref:alpha-1,2-Mannosidase n=1 Tax=Hypsibius exemplaris TaxID=2072580 RepID=A0A1W0X7G2_HYPEX|nr:ER degradation-enhancing alpha-mannosidase-like protein 3 [Hypsibius exemplaris]